MAIDTNSLWNQIIGDTRGTYGEGRFVTARQIVTNLEDQVNQGEITEDEYYQAMDSLAPKIQAMWEDTQRAGGKNIAAANQAGADQLINTQIRDYKIQKTASDLLGRRLTPTELTQVEPAWQGGDVEGRQAIGSLADYYKQNPLSDPTNEQRQQGPEQTSQNINSYFQNLLGREASPEEASYFSNLLNTGQADPYQVQNYIKQTPEYQTAQDKMFREGLAGELEGYDTSFFNRAKQNVLSRYAQSGQLPTAGAGTSPSLDYALTDLMGRIAENRGQYLAGLSAEQYGGNKAAAREDYTTAMNRLYGQQDYNTQRRDTLQDYLMGRGYGYQDYQRQKQDYYDQLQQLNQRQKPSTLDYINTGINLIGAFSGSGGGYGPKTLNTQKNPTSYATNWWQGGPSTF